MPKKGAAGFVRPQASGCSITVDASPGARRTEIIGVNPWRAALQVKVAARPRDGAANEELIAFLGDLLGLDRSRIRFLSGQRSARKTLFVPLPAEKVESVLGGGE